MNKLQKRTCYNKSTYKRPIFLPEWLKDNKKLQKLEDALFKQMLTAADRADQDEGGDWTDLAEAQLQKVFLPPGTDFLRRNFPNIEEEFS